MARTKVKGHKRRIKKYGRDKFVRVKPHKRKMTKKMRSKDLLDKMSFVNVPLELQPGVFGRTRINVPSHSTIQREYRPSSLSPERGDERFFARDVLSPQRILVRNERLTPGGRVVLRKRNESAELGFRKIMKGKRQKFSPKAQKAIRELNKHVAKIPGKTKVIYTEKNGLLDAVIVGEKDNLGRRPVMRLTKKLKRK